MTGSLWQVAVLVAIGLAWCDVAAGQLARAGLQLVSAASFDSGPNEGESRTVCLNRGGFVLAVARYPEQWAVAGVGYVREGGTGPDDVDLLVSMSIRPNDEAPWAWRLFIIDEVRTCVEIVASSARVRVYRLTVGVTW